MVILVSAKQHGDWATNVSAVYSDSGSWWGLTVTADGCYLSGAMGPYSRSMAY